MPRGRVAPGSPRRGGALAALTPTHPESLDAPARALLPVLGARPWAGEFYLAGSAALALYTAHRRVHELDLMSAANRLAPADRRDLLGDLRTALPGTQVETARDGYLYLRLPGSVGVRFFYYPYPLVDPLESIERLAVASAFDLGLMKLSAVISRGTRRDFVDLYRLCQALPLAALLARAEEKFGHVADFELQALKGLADLSETLDEPMPAACGGLAWDEVEAWLRSELLRLGRAHVGL